MICKFIQLVMNFFFLTSLSFLMCIWFEIKIAKVVCRPYGKIPATDLWPFIFASSNTSENNTENALIICEYLMVLSTLIYINLIDWVRFVVIYCIPSDHILRLTHTIRTSANHLSIFYLANKSTLWRHQPQLCEFIFFSFFALAINLSPSLLSFYSAACRQLRERIPNLFIWIGNGSEKVINLHQCQRTIFNFDKLCNHWTPTLVENARRHLSSTFIIYPKSRSHAHFFKVLSWCTRPQKTFDSNLLH